MYNNEDFLDEMISEIRKENKYKEVKDKEKSKINSTKKDKSDWKKATVSEPPKKTKRILTTLAALSLSALTIFSAYKGYIKLPDSIVSAFQTAVTELDTSKITDPDEKQNEDEDYSIFTNEQADEIIESIEEQQENEETAENPQEEKEEATSYENLKEYEGQFELPIEGATGVVGNLNLLFTDEKSGEQVNINSGETCTILGISEDETQFTIMTQNGKVGKVSSDLLWINLPDIVPSIIYKISNNDKALYTSLDESIDGITGEKLYTDYDCFQYNAKLGRNEYLVPVTFSMAKKIQAVQQDALSKGKSLVMYETFRPYSAQKAVVDALDKKYNGNDYALAQALNYGGNYGTWYVADWFIAQGASNHQYGIAMDCSLANVSNSTLGKSGEYKYTYHTDGDYEILKMPSNMHELSAKSAVYLGGGVSSYTEGAWKKGTWTKSFENSENAKLLQKLCTDNGLDPLSSEWWHFNDVAGYWKQKNLVDAQLKAENRIAGDFAIGDCVSVDDISKMIEEYKNTNLKSNKNQIENNIQNDDYGR